MTFVLDASVTLKWLLEDPMREPDTDKALDLLNAVVRGDLRILQPAHWLAEIAAVLARLRPQTAPDDIEALAAMELPVADEPSILRIATTLAIKTGQHVFDTLYHAVALEYEGAVLITADERYWFKTRRFGRIMALRDWTAR